MADIALQSGRVSSLASALATHTEKASFVPKLQKGPATHFREVVRTASTSGGFATTAKVDAGGKITMDVSKLGLLTKACVRIRITASATAILKNLNWAPNLLAAMISNIELGTSSRTLVSMSGQELARRINRSRHRSVYHRRGGYAWSGLGARYNVPIWTVDGTPVITANHDEFGILTLGNKSGAPTPIDIYVPLLFSCFDSDASKGLMTSFTESLKVTLTLRKRAAWCEPTGAAAVVMTALDASLVQQFIVPDAAIASSTIAATYPVGKSSQFIVSQEEILARHDITPAIGGYDASRKRCNVSVKLSSSSVSLLRGISCYVIKKKFLDGDVKFSNEYVPITSFTFKASGRTLIDTNAAESDMFSLSHLDDAPDNLHTAITPSGGAGGSTAGLHQYQEDNILTYMFAHSPHDRTYSSGHLSLAGCASQQYLVNFTIGHRLSDAETNSDDYSVVVVGHAISVKSVSSSSGAITNSLSV